MVAVLVLVVAAGELSLHEDEPALGEVLADELGSGAPGDDIEEVRLLAPILLLKSRSTAMRKDVTAVPDWGAPQLRVLDQTAHDDDLVEHRNASLFALADDQGTHDAVRDAKNTVQLLRERRIAGEAHQDVVAFVLEIDGISQLAAAPLFHFHSGTVLLGQGLELRHQRGGVLLTLCRSMI